MRTYMLITTLLLPLMAIADEPVQPAAEAADYYPFKTCIISGEPLGSMGDPVSYRLENGREVRFCCAGCTEDFEKAPDKYMLQIDNAIIEQQSDSYPLETCVVTGKTLGDMGEPANYIHGNRLVKFCCPPCADSFVEDADYYLALIDIASTSSELKDEPHHGQMED